MQARSRRIHTIAILTALREGPTSQARLAELLKVNQASVSRLLAPLVDSGLVRATPGEKTGRGRPATQLALVPSGRSAIAVFISRDLVWAGLTDLEGRCGPSVVRQRDRSSSSATLSQVARLAVDLTRRASAPTLGVGVVVAGEVDAEAGTVRSNSDLGWHDVEVAAPLSAAIGVPVVVDSVIRATLNAELSFGRLPPESRVLLVAVGDLTECGYALPTESGWHVTEQGSLARLIVPGLREGSYGPYGVVGTDRAAVDEAVTRGLDIERAGDLQAAAEAGQPTAVDLIGRRHDQLVAAIGALCDIGHPDQLLLRTWEKGDRAAASRVRQDFADRFPPDAIRGGDPRETPFLSPAAGLAIRQALEVSVA
jgi:predicted NBD/HSP70 family sugar kinase